MSVFTRVLCLHALLCAGLAAQPDPREVVRRSVEAFEDANSKIALSYTFLERVDARQLEDDGRVKSKAVKAYDVTLVEGSPYRRLVQRDDKPLPPDEERGQQENLRRNIEARRKETPDERAKRLAEFEKERNKFREALREIPDAYDFKLIAEKEIEGRPVYVLSARPRPGYRPRSRYAKLYPHMNGTLWISKTGYRWVRTEAELIENYNFGWILLRVAKGARVELEQTRVNDEVWLPRRIWFLASARVGLFKRYHVQQENSYSRYRKFQADSEIISTRALP